MMKMIVASLVVVAVVAVTAMPNAEPEPQPENTAAALKAFMAFTPPSTEDIARLTQTKKDMDTMMKLCKLCMVKKIMSTCGCTSIEGGCPVTDAMMKCKSGEMRSRMLSKMVDENDIMDFPGMKQSVLDSITDEHCSVVLPPPKMMLKMVMKDDASWHTMMVCMISQGQFDNYNTCVLDEFRKYMPIIKKQTPAA